MHRTYRLAFLGLVSSQFWVISIQFIFSIYVTRFFEPKVFAAYAVTLSLLSLVGIIFQLGLGNAASRIDHNSHGDISMLFRISLFIGLIGSITTILISTFWSMIWDSPKSAIFALLMSPTVLMSVGSSVLMGRTLKRERYNYLSKSRFISAFIASVLSFLIIRETNSDYALVSFPVLLSTFTFTFLFIDNFSIITEQPNKTSLSNNLVFAFRSFKTSFARYMIFTIPVYLLSRQFGPNLLGNWNRAVTFFQVPFEQFTGSLRSIIYPKYATLEKSNEMFLKNATKVLKILTWLTLPASFALAPAISRLVEFIFPDHWHYLPQLSIFFMLSLTSVLLATVYESMLEASNHQTICFYSVLAGGISIAFSCLLSLLFQKWEILGLVPMTSALAIHICQLFFTGKYIGLQVTSIWKTYLPPLLLALLFNIEMNLILKHWNLGFVFFLISIPVMSLSAVFYIRIISNLKLNSIFEID